MPESCKGAGPSGNALVGFPGNPINGDLDVAGRVLFEKPYVIFVDEGGIGEDRNQQSSALERHVDLREVIAQERLAPRNEAPNRTQGNRLIGKV